jgi:beta-glucanase (GH16 family)
MLTAVASALLILIPTHQSADPKAGKKLVFNQDFSKIRRIDPNIWQFDDGPVYNNEKETYTAEAARNAWIENKALVIEARKEGTKITSARLVSRPTWKYGYIEATVEVPVGKGTWPAFWMLGDRLRRKGAENLGWPKCGEIDIMEQIGADPKPIHFSLHTDKYNWMKKEQRTKVVNLSDPTGFHTYGLNWTPKSIDFYLDGKPVYHVDKTEDTIEAWPFDDKFYIILNLAIGGNMGGPIDNNIFPCRYRIKNVRVYQ